MPKTAGLGASMAEESEGLETGAEASGAGVDPFAAAMALGGASREKANQFLEEQIALTRLQAKELAHELKLRHWSLQLRHASAILKFALEVSIAFIAVALACIIGAVVWNAAHANSLLIEAFSVPPDMDQQGLNGQTLAKQLLDQITVMNDVNNSYRSIKSYSNNWDNQVQVEIPETGISVNEAYQFLRNWLGHDTRITGEIRHTATGIALTVRSGDEAGATFAGTEADLDTLVVRAAEHVFSQTQLYRYAGYLRRHNRYDEARTIYAQLTESADPEERAWAWNGIATVDNRQIPDVRVQRLDMDRAFAAYPDFAFGYTYAASVDSLLSWPEAELADRRRGDQLLSESADSHVRSDWIDALRLWGHMSMAALLGDYQGAVTLGRSNVTLPVIDGNEPRASYRHAVAEYLVRQHDMPAARRALSEMPGGPPLSANEYALQLRLDLAIAAEKSDWQGLAVLEPQQEKAVLSFENQIANTPLRTPNINRVVAGVLRPYLIQAKAKLGDFAGAETLIAPTAGDCYDCQRLRGEIASAANQPGRADYWFARAVEQAPSIPFAYADWGAALLDRGDADDAIAKFKLANQKGPHFADPLEGWGEALMKKSRSDLALAKFAEAEKYAPNWGRLHLKWGEALGYAGKKDEAQKQFAKAATLDLTPDEKSELARSHVVATNP